jgi:CubicO group peptidase (beta-lactamase class C family)
VTKVFTCLLLADAVVRGEVSLDDPVAGLLPPAATIVQVDGQPIRLWHLATHTSGLPRLPDMKGSDPRDPYAHFDDDRLFEALGALRLRRAPGERYVYSNLGVGLLGRALAHKLQAAGYDAALRERVLAPLGLRATSCELPADAPPRTVDGDGEHAWRLAALAGAGGLRSDADDLLAFLQAQWAPPDALRAATQLALQKRHDGSNGIALGLGWHIARDGKTRLHSGGTGGYRSFVAVAPDDRRAVVVLANTTSDLVDAVGERLLQRLYGMAVEPPKIERAVAVPDAQLARLVGDYRMPIAGVMRITRDARGLVAQLSGQPALRLHPRSPTEFFYRAVDAWIGFEVDGDAATALTLHQNGQRIRCARVGKDDGGR